MNLKTEINKCENPVERIRIGIVDDHNALRSGLVTLIEKTNGLLVDLEASTGDELLKKLENCKLLPDVLLLDLNLKGMDGFEICTLIKSQYPTIKILCFSFSEKEYDILNFMKCGGNGYLSKTADLEEITMAISKVVRMDIYMNKWISPATLKRLKDFKQQNILLTETETKILSLAATDLSYALIAKELDVSVKSVEGYRDGLFRKFEVHNRIGLVLAAVKHGFISID